MNWPHLKEPTAECLPVTEIQRHALQPGHRLHWYEIIRVLGRGGFGITYLARDLNLGREVAIKEYLPSELAVRESDATVHPIDSGRHDLFEWGLRRFIEESKTLAHFDHPNIVRVLMEFEDNNTAYMVMRYERGRSLHEALAGRGTLEEAELLEVLMPVLDGLEQVHDTGFIHRDIKPANIFLRDDGSPVLLDFGSARQSLGMGTQTLTTLVSPGYAAFEQYCSDSDEQGPWTDIYGLGATAYRAVTGSVPMYAVDRSQAILKTGQDAFVPATQCAKDEYSASVLAAIDHALGFSKACRPQNIGEWRREFTNPPLSTDVRTVVALPVEAAGAPALNRREIVGLERLRALPGLWYGAVLLLLLPIFAFGWFHWLPSVKVKPAALVQERPATNSSQAAKASPIGPPVRVAFTDAWKDSFFGPETMVIFYDGYRIGGGDESRGAGSQGSLHRFVKSGRRKTLPIKIDNLAARDGPGLGNRLVLDFDTSARINAARSETPVADPATGRAPVGGSEKAAPQAKVPPSGGNNAAKPASNSPRGVKPARASSASKSASKRRVQAASRRSNRRSLSSSRSRAARADRANRGRGSGERRERLAHVERVDRAARPERSGRPAHAARPERPQRIERPERPQRPERIERPERPERPQRVERPERPERVARPERVERPERPDRSGRR